MRSLILIALLTFAADAMAQEMPEIDTDRPDQTESSSVLPAGTFQIEAGVHYAGNEVERAWSLPALLVRVSALDWLEARVVAEYARFGWSNDAIDPRPTESAATLGVGTKVQLTREDGAFPEIALLAHLSRDFDSEEFTPDFRLSMGHSFANGLELGYNLGAEWPAFGGMVSVYTIALGLPIGSTLGAYAEIFGDYDPAFGILNSTFDAGVTFRPQNNFQIDLSVGRGIGGQHLNNDMAGVGVSYRFPH